MRSRKLSALHTVLSATKLLQTLAVVVAIAVAYLFWSWNHALHPGSANYIVKAGTGFNALAAELERRGTLLETRSFVLLGYATVGKREIKSGEYRFRDGMNAREILEQVAAGRVVEYPLRFVEGWTFRQLLDEMAKAPNLAHTLKGKSHAEIMTELGAPGLHPEGRFYPDTYFYASGQSDLVILRRAYERMQARLQREWENRDADLPLRSADEALVLASIIEKETARSEERQLIAGVFINRLNKRIRLGTDPTVIYGLGEKFDGNLRKKDLLTDTPYNTYTRHGLPPTPIALPGGESVYAAVHPEKTQALYFVSRGNGSHEFSDSLEAHNRAVSKYQLGGRPFPALPAASPAGTPKAQ